MSKTRKTISIDRLVALVNEHNKVSTCRPEIRTGWNALLEEVLMQTDTYGGYNYLTQAEVPAGHEPGVTGKVGCFSFPDESRRRYHRRNG